MNFPNSLLTDAQREYLRGEKEYGPTDSSGRMTESRIRGRVFSGLVDGRLLWHHLDADLRAAIFDEWREFVDADDPDAEADDQEMRSDPTSQHAADWRTRIAAEDGLVGWLAFLYLGVDDSDAFEFDTMLERAIAKAEQTRGREVTAFEFDVESRPVVDLEDLRARFEAGEELTTAQIARLRGEDVIDGADLAEYYDSLPPTAVSGEPPL